MACIGTPFFALLRDDVGLRISISNPILILGLSRTTTLGMPLPIDLGAFGAPGFDLLVSIDALSPPTAPTGSHHAEVAFGIPYEPTLIGAVIYAQWAINDPGANPAGVALTRAAVLRIE